MYVSLLLAISYVRLLPIPSARARGVRMADAEFTIRRVREGNTADTNAYQVLMEGRDRTSGLKCTTRLDQRERTVSVRWDWKSDVIILIAALSDTSTIVGTVEMIGPLEANSAIGGIEEQAGLSRRRGLPRRYLLPDVWVADAYRRQGVGRRLLAAAEAAALSSGVDYISLTVLGDNAAGLALYEGLGYREVEERLTWLPRWARGDIIFGKDLDRGR